MILAIDIGNTNIVVGCIENGKIEMTARVASDRQKTGDEYALFLQNLLKLHGISQDSFEGGIISSVVPPLSGALQYAAETVIGRKMLLVSSGLKTGLNIRMDNPRKVGADLIVDGVAALNKYKPPILIFDMGTATTMSLIDEQGCYAGGMIIPGAVLSLNALSSRTSQLPHVGVEAPKSLIGKNTVDCMRSGIVYSNAAMLDGLIERVADTMSKPLTVVATGGLSEVIVPFCKQRITLEPDLLLEGLWLIYCKNK